MACAHAKWTGEVGVCLATSGPGAIHLLNGLYDAKLDHQPVLAIVGQQARTALGGSYQQEVDLQTLFKDVAHEYVQMATRRRRRSGTSSTARIRIALDQRDGHLPDRPQRPRRGGRPSRSRRSKHGTIHSSPGWTAAARSCPSARDLERAAEILNAGEKVAMLSARARSARTNEVEQVAEKLGAGVAKALLGKAVLDDSLPYCTGSIGLLGTKPSWTLMNECDTLLMVGSSLPLLGVPARAGQARGVQIDIDGRMLEHPLPDGARARRRREGDARRSCSRCSSARATASWRAQIEDEVARVVAADRGARACRTPTRSTRSASSGS